MTKETLYKANKLVNELEECKNNLQKIEYTQSESVVIRESYLRFNSIESSITIPKSLFRTIGKLIESANLAVNGEHASVSVNVKADLRRGSFVVDLEILQFILYP